MKEFQTAVEGWHDFYVALSAATATLMGLLFVGISLNLEIINRQANADLRLVASQTFTNFIEVVLISFLFLIPNLVPAGLGIPMLFMGAYALWHTIRLVLTTMRTHPHMWTQRRLFIQAVLPVICFAGLVIVALTTLLGNTDGLYWLPAFLLTLIALATNGAWDLLLQVRMPKDGSEAKP
ncbi:MAG: hypothetical protein ABI947_12180 [Chloroflexota bacterium]